MNQLKTQALELRKAGYSYNMIRQKIGVSKSTLSSWLIHLPFEPNEEVTNRIGQARTRLAIARNRIKINSIQRAKDSAKRDIGTLSDRDLFLLGIGLYWGEGAKAYENIRIVNADPRIIRLAIKWFRTACEARTENFRPRIHLYPDNNVKETLRFWSDEIGIPLKQFGKIFVDSRVNKSGFKKSKLPYGTLHLYIKSNGDSRLGVDLHRRILAWIEHCVSQI